MRSYSHLQIKDPLASRFSHLRESGLSIDEAWKVMAVEILTDVGLLEPRLLEEAGASSGPQQVQVLIAEAKLVTTVRVEPEEIDRINRLVAQARAETTLSMGDKPSQSSIIRQALRLGLGDLERRNVRKESVQSSETRREFSPSG